MSQLLEPALVVRCRQADQQIVESVVPAVTLELNIYVINLCLINIGAHYFYVINLCLIAVCGGVQGQGEQGLPGQARH